MFVGLLEVGRSHGLMMFGRMVFGKIIGAVCVAGAPEDVELPLTRAVTNPVKPHVNGFRPLLFDGVIDDAAGGAVVRL